MAQSIDRWRVCCEETGGQPTLFDIRDLVVECLIATHGRRFGETRAALGLDSGEPAVRDSVQGIVRLAFQLTGGSYDAPTVDTLAKVVNVLSERALGWGVPADTVFEQHCAVMRCLGLAVMAQPDEEDPDRQSY